MRFNLSGDLIPFNWHNIKQVSSCSKLDKFTVFTIEFHYFLFSTPPRVPEIMEKPNFACLKFIRQRKKDILQWHHLGLIHQQVYPFIMAYSTISCSVLFSSTASEKQETDRLHYSKIKGGRGRISLIYAAPL